MSRWSRAPREPLPPAPGMILPGVPLAPMAGSTQVQERGSDPLADPERELAAQQARATQPLPVRIVVPSQPVADDGSASSGDESDATDIAPIAEVVPTLQRASSSPPEVADRVPTPQAATPSPEPRIPAPRGSSDVLARGPWPDPEGPSWPRSIPPWGAPPRGFAPVESRVGVVMKDGSHIAPSPAEARQMLGLVASLGG